MRSWVLLVLCLMTTNAMADEQQPPSATGGNEASSKNVADAVDPNATVLLKVSIIEFPLTKLRRLGIDWANVKADKASDTAAAQQSKVEKKVDLFGDSAMSSMGCRLLPEDDKLFLMLKAMVMDNLAKIVAKPTLVTQSGRAASFNSGGEIPVPVPQSAGTTTIEWKRYGVQVDFCPIVMNKEMIHMEIRPRVSELDESQSVTIQGTKIPGLRSTEMDTAIKMKTNQIAVISGVKFSRAVKDDNSAGKKQKESKPDAQKTSPQETSEEFEMLMLIKPEIVEPAK